MATEPQCHVTNHTVYVYVYADATAECSRHINVSVEFIIYRMLVLPKQFAVTKWF